MIDAYLTAFKKLNINRMKQKYIMKTIVYN